MNSVTTWSSARRPSSGEMRDVARTPGLGLAGPGRGTGTAGPGTRSGARRWDRARGAEVSSEAAWAVPRDQPPDGRGRGSTVRPPARSAAAARRRSGGRQRSELPRLRVARVGQTAHSVADVVAPTSDHRRQGRRAQRHRPGQVPHRPANAVRDGRRQAPTRSATWAASMVSAPSPGGDREPDRAMQQPGPGLDADANSSWSGRPVGCRVRGPSTVANPRGGRRTPPRRRCPGVGLDADRHAAPRSTR